MFLNTFEHFRNVRCGLLSFPAGSDKDGGDEDNPNPVPLKSVEVQATIVHAAAEVVVTQTYVNNKDEPIDSYFYFPLRMEDAVTGFEVEIGDTILKNLVVRDEGRQDAYDEAIQKHPKRFWTKSADPVDVYQTRVGLVQPQSQLTLSIAYVTEVKLSGEKIQLTIPNTVVPRVESPQASIVSRPPAVSQPRHSIARKEEEDDDVILLSSSEEEEEDVEMDDETSVAVDPGSVKIILQFLLEGDGSIGALESDTHVPQVTVIDTLPDKPNWSTATVEFEGNFSEMSTDFSVSITPTDVLSPRMYIEETEDETVLMSTFCPLLPLPDVSTPQFMLGIDSPSPDIKAVAFAGKAIRLLLKSLPPDAEFNLIGLGAHSREFLFPELQVHDENTVREALRLISSGLKPPTSTTPHEHLPITTLFEKVFAQAQSSEFITQIILVLQRGIEKDQFQTCQGIVRRHTQAHKSRLFIIGIGNLVDASMIQQLATAGEGFALVLPFGDVDNSSWEPSVTSFLDLCSSPSLTDVKLIWSDWDARVKAAPVPDPKTMGDSEEVMIVDESAGTADKQPFVQIPDTPFPVFNATQFVTFGIFVHKYYPRVLDVQGISYAKASESLEYNYNIQLNELRDRHLGSMDTITKLAYAKAIRQLEEKMRQFSDGTRKTRSVAERTKERILQIATREGIPSKYTSFATVEVETGREVKGHWTRQTRYTNNPGAISNANAPSSTTWNSRIPSGSISRTKLNSIRNLSGMGGAPLSKIPRTATLTVVADSVVDLTDDHDVDSSPPVLVAPELIIIGD